MYNLNWHLQENAPGSITSKQIMSHHQDHRKLLAPAAGMPVLFSKVGDTIEDKILPGDFFNMQFYLDTAAYVKFNLTLNRNARLGIYADKNSPPTLTKFKLFETFDGSTLLPASVRIICLTFFGGVFNYRLI